MKEEIINEEEQFEWRRKYRPRTLDQVVGNVETTNALKGMKAKNRFPHCILLSGPYGSGKSSLARIIRRELGCHKLDYREVNAASVRGIDSIREITGKMHILPMVGKCRVWFLDELHKLTGDAREALLVPTENAPKHVYFILGTTNPEMLSEGIRSRATSLRTEPLTDKEMKTLLRRVAEKESMEVTEDFISQVIEASGGCARMGLNLLEKASCLEPGERAQAIKTYRSEQTEAIDLCRALIGKKPWDHVAGLLKTITGEPESIRRAVLGYATSCLLGHSGLRAYNVIRSFERNFYDSGKAGLAGSCFEVIELNKK